MSSERDIWQPHEDPLLAPLEDRMYALGAGFIMRVHQDTFRALGLPGHPADDVRAAYRANLLAKADSGESWNAAARAFNRLREVRRSGQPPAPALYARFADRVTQKWLEEGRLTDRARATAVATYLLGHLQAGDLLAGDAIPTFEEVRAGRAAARLQANAEYAAEHAAEHMQALTESLRHDVKGVVLSAAQNGDQPQKLATELFRKFATNARDWRRVAITEASFNRNNGYLAGLIGQTVEAHAARDACKHCRDLHGRKFLVVAEDHEPKDPQAHVWPGKTQRGHRIGENPALPMHPHCRCRWLRAMQPASAAVDPRIRDAVAALLEKARTPFPEPEE